LPGHLVRCGNSTPYDISFGKQAGGGAVLLLQNGIAGVTIEGVSNGEDRYMDTNEAIKQRYVCPEDVDFYEKMGVCFGREVKKEFSHKFRKVTGHIERYM